MFSYLKSAFCGCTGIIVCIVLSSVGRAEELTAANVKNAIVRGMKYLDGKAGTNGQQYSDYVVFCGLSVEKEFPEYRDIITPYKKWIIKNDRFNGKKKVHLYVSSCHVMALDRIGEQKKAKEMADKFKPYANNGKWSNISYHLGWYLYCSIVMGDKELVDKTYKAVYGIYGKNPDCYQYFVAYCLLKIYEKTKDNKYQQFFLMYMNKLKKHKVQYLEIAPKDGHMGMTLYDFCIAYKLTQNKEYKAICDKMAKIMLDTQQKDGSWNKSIAYTIMPVEGLTAYLKYCLKIKQ